MIIVDLGPMIGNDLYLTTLSLATEILAESRPRPMLVKSKSRSSLARRLIPAQHLVEGPSKAGRAESIKRTIHHFDFFSRRW